MRVSRLGVLGVLGGKILIFIGLHLNRFMQQRQKQAKRWV
jgi:hypothetical protein